MNRRAFARNLVGAGIGAAALRRPSLLNAEGVRTPGASVQDVPFKLSVMLWTVFRDLPFERRLEKVAEAGYTNVELVGEYEKWSQDDFNRANAKRKELGISFDATAGLKHSLCNPEQRDALLAELRAALVPMEKIGCPSMIVLTGDVVPTLSREIQHQSCVDGLKAAADLVADKKINGEPVRILLENIDPEENPKYYLTSVAEGFEIVKAEKNIEHVALVHVADVPGRHEPGTGEINYKSIFRKLFELNYRGVVAMEFLPTSDPVGKLRAAREMAMNAGGK